MIFLSGKMNKKPPKTQPKTCWIAHQLFLQINSAFCCMESLKTIGKEYFKTSSFFHCKFLFSYPVHPYCVHLTSIKTKDQTSGICVIMSIEWWKVLNFFFMCCILALLHVKKYAYSCTVNTYFGRCLHEFHGHRNVYWPLSNGLK